MKVSIVNINPGIAHEMMSRNTNNFRRIDSRRVEQYAREMKSGLWQNNGEAIQIYEDGTIANGQHRLSAVIKADVELPFVIVTGVKKNVTTFDVGGKRSFSQIAHYRGFSISTQTAGALAIILFGVGDKASRYGTDEVISYYQKVHETIDEVHRIMSHGSDKPLLRRASCEAAAYSAVVLGKISLQDLDMFATITNKGLPIDGIVSNSPLCLRKTIMDGFRDKIGVAVIWGKQSAPWYFETTYRAICDFAKQSTPMRAYKPKMTNEDVNKIIKQVREKGESNNGKDG